MKIVSLSMILIVLLSPLALADQVYVTDDLITIIGDQQFNWDAYRQRQEKMEAIGMDEIEYHRAVELEDAKYRTALMLERADAPRINVHASASASNKTNVRMRQDND